MGRSSTRSSPTPTTSATEGKAHLARGGRAGKSVPVSQQSTLAPSCLPDSSKSRPMPHLSVKAVAESVARLRRTQCLEKRMGNERSLGIKSAMCNQPNVGACSNLSMTKSVAITKQRAEIEGGVALRGLKSRTRALSTPRRTTTHTS